MVPTVMDVMTQRAEPVPPDATARSAAATMRRLDVGGLPVVDDGRLVGIVTDRDLVVRVLAAPDGEVGVLVADIMTPGELHVYASQDVRIAAQAMKDHNVRRLVVTDRKGRPIGIVSLGDIALGVLPASATGSLIADLSRSDPPDEEEHA
jgi:CBS domain-containing protein